MAMATSRTTSDMLVSYIGGYARKTRDIHKTVFETHIKIENLLHEIDQSESNDLNEVKKAIRQIAAEYKDSQDDSLALVKRTEKQAQRVHKAAGHVLQRTITPVEALRSMDINFESLTEDIGKVKKRHSAVCVNLKEQAYRAKEAKLTNDERAKMAGEIKENAELAAILAIPGVGLIGGPIALAQEFAEENEDSGMLVKVVKGTGGALLGLGLGVGLTAISPFLLAYSGICGARLAVLSRNWSKTFKDIEGKINEVHDIIDQSCQHLSDIKTCLSNLKTDIDQWNPSIRHIQINVIFEDIANSSIELSKACEQYQESLKSSNKRLKQIGVENTE